MSTTNCSDFISCDNSNLSVEQLFKLLVSQTANGCPAFRVVTPDDVVEDQLLHGVTADITTATTTDLLSAPAIGLRYYIDSIMVTNSHASTGTWVKIICESGATLITGYAAAAGGGFTCTYPKGLQQPVQNKKLSVITESAANVRVSVNAVVKA